LNHCFRAGAPKRFFVDYFCLRQAQSDFVLDSVQSAIGEIGFTLLAASPIENPAPLTRTFGIFEINAAIQSNSRLEVDAGLCFEQFMGAWSAFEGALFAVFMVHGSENVAAAECRSQTHKNQIDNMIRAGECFLAIDLKVEKALAERFKCLSLDVLLVTFLFLGLALLSCFGKCLKNHSYIMEPYSISNTFFNYTLAFYGALLLGGRKIGVPMVLIVVAFWVLNGAGVLSFYRSTDDDDTMFYCVSFYSSTFIAAWPLIALVFGALWHLSVTAIRAVHDAPVESPQAPVECLPLRTKAWQAYQMLLRAVALAVALYIKFDGAWLRPPNGTEGDFWNWPPTGDKPMFHDISCPNPWAHQQAFFFQRKTVVHTQLNCTLFV